MFDISEDEIREQLDPAKVISALEDAFRHQFPKTIIPARTHITTANGVFLVMSCHDPLSGRVGVKLVTVLNESATVDRIQATYMLLDPVTAKPTLIIPANYLTDLRTAATSALATKFLAREDAQVLGIFGTGRQARAHAKVLPLVRNFSRILVCGTKRDKSFSFADEMSAHVNVTVEPADAATCTAQSDVLCTCTTGLTSVVEGDLIRPGTHLNLIGAFRPQCREVDSRTIQRARIVVDTYDATLAEAGDLLIPMNEGLITRKAILSDLHELISRKKTIRRSDADITVFKSVGCALEDLVTASLLQTSQIAGSRLA